MASLIMSVKRDFTVRETTNGTNVKKDTTVKRLECQLKLRAPLIFFAKVITMVLIRTAV
jgi:hypothetical protein